MLKRLVVGLLLALLAIAALPVLAQTAAGTGTLTAEGDGSARVHCQTCDITISGNGKLMILDTTGEASISVTGTGEKSERITERGTLTIYRGFDGTAEISGGAIGVGLRGESIDLFAQGTGAVWLRGEGTYTVNGTENSWSANGEVVRLNG